MGISVGRVIADGRGCISIGSSYTACSSPVACCRFIRPCACSVGGMRERGQIMNMSCFILYVSRISLYLFPDVDAVSG